MTVWLWTLGACTFGLTPLDPSSLDEEDDDAPVKILEIDPMSGPPSGGTPVTVTGRGFVGDVVLDMSGVAITTLTVINDETLSFETPRFNQVVTVDLTVTSDLGDDTFEGGFSFEEEGDDTGSDTGDDSGDSGDSGTTGDGLSGYVEMGLLVYGCAECFGLDDALQVDARAAFHEDVADEWLDWLPAAGSCVQDPDTRPPAVTFYDVGSVSLTGGASSFSLTGGSDATGVTYDAVGLTIEDIPQSTTFDLSAGGGSDFSSFSATGVALTGAGPSTVDPVGLLSPDLSSAWSEVLSRAGDTITWSAGGTNDLIVVTLDVYGAGARGYLGTVVCAEDDNGSLSLPATYLGNYDAGSRAVVTISRIVLGTFDLPDGGTGESMTYNGFVGTAELN